LRATVEFRSNGASGEEIAAHLLRCDADFRPALSSRIDIAGYAAKITQHAVRFEAWSASRLIGLVAAYCNDQRTRIAYITSVSVLREHTGRGVGADLVEQCVAYARSAGMRQIALEVARDNLPAVRLYEKLGFVADPVDGPVICMRLSYRGEEEHDQRT
jgi:ribosomal protein S18 acetylase RimI-like enzyme